MEPEIADLCERLVCMNAVNEIIEIDKHLAQFKLASHAEPADVRGRVEYREDLAEDEWFAAPQRSGESLQHAHLRALDIDFHDRDVGGPERLEQLIACEDRNEHRPGI